MAKQMLFESIVEAVIKGSLDEATAITPGEEAERARICVEYYNSTEDQQEHLTEEHAALHTKADRWKATPKVVYNIVRAITETLCTLYTDPIVYTFPDDADGKLADKYFSRLKNWRSVMRDVDIFTFLASLLAVRPVWRERENEADRVKFTFYLPHQITYVQDPEDMTEAVELVFEFMTGQGDAETTVRHYWNADRFVETVDDEIVKDEGRQEFENPYKEVPVTLFRNRDARWEFYPEPAWDLVVANLTLNGQTTMLNRLAINQAFSTLMTIGAPEGFRPEVGLDTFLNVTNPPGSNGAGAAFLQPDANFTGVVSTINTCLSLFFASRRIPESAIMAKQVGDSGVALVAQAASLVSYRRDRIATMTSQEQDLIKKTIKVMHLHETGELKDFPAPEIKYTELKTALSTEERDEWDWKISQGVATPLDLYKALHPGVKESDAEAEYERNLEEKRGTLIAGIPPRMQPAGPQDGTGEAPEGEDTGEAPIAERGATSGQGAPLAAAGDVQKTALNGAQVVALAGVIKDVSIAALDPEAAVQMILLSFPNFPEDAVRKMVQAAVETEPPEEPAPAPPPPPADATGGQEPPERLPTGDEDNPDDEDEDEAE